MGRWSRRLATEFVAWNKPAAGWHWLDVGCGTGALASAICAGADPASVTACDPAAPFIEFARGQGADERIAFTVAGVGALPAHPPGYDCVMSLLALNFFPDHAAAVKEMAALVRPGGTVSACVWDYAGRMEFLRMFWDAVLAEDPVARDQDEGVRFPVCDQKALSGLFTTAGLTNVACAAIDVPTRFTSFRDYWDPFLGATGPAGAYVANLDPGRREHLARRLEQTLPHGEDSTIDLIARAWAVRGTVSSPLSLIEGNKHGS